MTSNVAKLPVVVGVDGSAAALQAALWAVAESAGRGVPMRLLSVVEPDAATVADETARAAAGAALRAVHTAISESGHPAGIDADIAAGHPITTLLQASAEATLLCVGAVGFRHFADGHIGSTAQTLAERAYCPVAIIRDGTLADGPVVAIVNDMADATPVLQLAAGEAALRGAVLRVLATSEHSDGNTADRLNRALAPWAHRYPDLDIDVVVAHTPLLDHLAQNPERPQLLVVGPATSSACRELFSPNGHALLQHSRCALLIATGGRTL